MLPFIPKHLVIILKVRMSYIANLEVDFAVIMYTSVY